LAGPGTAGTAGPTGTVTQPASAAATATVRQSDPAFIMVPFQGRRSRYGADAAGGFTDDGSTGAQAWLQFCTYG
jgi:hypothetical protein